VDIFKNVWVWASGFAITALIFIRGLLIYKIRLTKSDATFLYDALIEKGKYFSTQEEISDERLPKIFSAYCRMNKLLFHLSLSERMLQAGMSGTDTVADVMFLRFQRNRFKTLIYGLRKSQIDSSEINVNILMSWDAMKIGTLKIPQRLPIPYMDEEKYIGIEHDIMETLKNKSKLGVLLYGPAGNGKTYFIRYIALKYRLPIYIVSLHREIDNQNLITMFAQLREPCIVLFEDFDEFFNCREPLIDRAKFTLDTLLNVFDGLFCSPRGTIIFMTANNINKVDPALKSRPSRFKHVVEVQNPNSNIRNMVFSSLNGNREQAVSQTEGLSLDILLHIKEKILEGCEFGVALNDCKQYVFDVEKSKEKERNRIKQIEAKELEKKKAEEASHTTPK
jgi:hypothetical protein